MMLVMLLMLQKLSVNLVGCRRKHLKLDYAKRFSGIWTMTSWWERVLSGRLSNGKNRGGYMTSKYKGIVLAGGSESAPPHN